MSKPSPFHNPAFQQTTAAPIGSGFNFVTQFNSFSSVFDTKPLEKDEAEQLEKLLSDNAQTDLISFEQLEQDKANLKQITAEIKSIGKQGAILMGERVQRASELLKPYRDGTFTKWLEVTFGTRKTGYNLMNYYALYNELPNEELRQKFKKIPQRAAYILASRKAENVDVKAEIIDQYHNLGHKELVGVIQEKLPLASDDKRCNKGAATKLIASIHDSIEKLQACKESLTNEDRSSLLELMKMLSSVC
jgi:DUF438 domain-containing protein